MPERRPGRWRDDRAARRSPGAKGNKGGDKPTITVSLPPADKATGAAVVVCPGGGYGGLAMDHEGRQIFDWLNSHGIAAAVLTYRHRGTGYAHPAPMLDAQRAIRTVRSRTNRHRLPGVSSWPDRCVDWMRGRGLLKKRSNK